MYTEKKRLGFSEVAESLKKYRRADLVDQNGQSVLDELYVDLLEGNAILSKCLLNNTTFLIGRKGTGKSTIFWKLENEYRKMKGYLPCYVDVRTCCQKQMHEPLQIFHFRSRKALLHYLAET